MRYVLFFLLAFVGGCVSGASMAPMKPPAYIGVALPTPTLPLKQVKGLAGPIPKNDGQTLDLYVQNFEQLNFHTEWQGPDPWVRKWNRSQNLQVRFNHPAGSISGTLEEIALIRVVRTLKQITGVHIGGDTSQSQRYDIFLDFTEKEDPEQSCVARTRNEKDGSISEGVIFVGASPYNTKEQCLVEELSQSLGPINDTMLVNESLWRPFSVNASENFKTYHWLTWHDAIQLRTLYHYELKPGMPKDQAMPIARKIIKKLLDELNA